MVGYRLEFDLILSCPGTATTYNYSSVIYYSALLEIHQKAELYKRPGPDQSMVSFTKSLILRIYLVLQYPQNQFGHIFAE